MISMQNFKGFCMGARSSRTLAVALLWGFIVAGLGLGFPKAFSVELDKKPADEKERREQLHQIRMKQIPLLEQFLTKYAGSPRVPDSLYRLGEAHFEAAKYFEAMGDKARSSYHVGRALTALETLRKDHSSYQRLDEALFVLANSYIQTQQMDQAGSVLAEISEKYPKSPILKDASLLLGDYYFSKQQFARADSYYQTAAQNPKMQSYVYYKLAWVNMNLQQTARALQYFEKVLALRSEAQNSGGDYSREAAREMVFAALEVHKSKGIVSYLTETLKDPELVRLGLMTLAKGLMQRSQFADASDVWAVLQTTYPQAQENAEWISEQLKAEEALGRTTQIGTLVAKLSTSAGDAQKVQSQVYNTAKKYHAQAQKSTDSQEKNKLYDMAISYYEALLGSALPDHIKAEGYFYLGESLYARGLFARASQAYESASRSKSDFQARAVWSWFLTAEKLADGFQYQGKTLKATSSADEKYLEAARFMQDVSGITLEQKRKASYQSARLLYQLNDLERALPVFQALADQYAGTQEGKLSAQLVLDIYNLRKDYKAVAQYARSYSAKADGSSKAELSQLEQTALLKSLQESETQAKALEGEAKMSALMDVSRQYMEFARQYPRAAQIDSVIWAAFEGYAYVTAEKTSQSEEAFRQMKTTFELLSRSYRSSKHSDKAIEIMGRLLAYKKLKPAELREFADYREAWERQWTREPRETRGAMGMLVFKLSSDAQRDRLVREFHNLPDTPDNHEAIAWARLEKLKDFKRQVDGVSLAQLKTLKANTKRRMELLDKLKTEVTSLVKLQVPAPALESLKLLGDSYEAMADAMRKAPIPKGLEGENLEKYKSIVSEAAKDMESQGLEARRLADEKAREIDLSAS